jgi:predicted Zn-ribbon and HTH transcriptional regulator
MPDDQEKEKVQGECTIPQQVPAEELERYRVDADPHSERDIANYVEGQARDETVQHVEKIKREIILGSEYDMWDVVTDKGRWWVITNLTNLYSQTHFPSLDYTLSFHIGLMTRVRARSDRIDAEAPQPFDEVFRRMDQAERKHDAAVEAEDYQAVGVQLREGLVSLIDAMRRRVEVRSDDPLPQASNFLGWSDVLMNALCPGSSNKELRQHLKNTSKETWQIANWLAHHRSAGKTASSIAIHSCQTTVGHFIQVLERNRIDKTDTCPVCKSRDIRSHFDIMISPDGDYYASCGTCKWTDHPGSKEA